MDPASLIELGTMFVPQMYLRVFTLSTSFPVLFEQRFVAPKKWCNLHAWPESWGVLRFAPKKCVTAFQGNKSLTNVDSIKGFCWKNYEFQIPALLFLWAPKIWGRVLLTKVQPPSLQWDSRFLSRPRHEPPDVDAWGKVVDSMGEDMLGRPSKCCVLLDLARRDSNEYFTVCPNANHRMQW